MKQKRESNRNANKSDRKASATNICKRRFGGFGRPLQWQKGRSKTQSAPVGRWDWGQTTVESGTKIHKHPHQKVELGAVCRWGRRLGVRFGRGEAWVGAGEKRNREVCCIHSSPKTPSRGRNARRATCSAVPSRAQTSKTACDLLGEE